MKRGRIMLICTVAGLAVCSTSQAVTSETSGSPYQGIVVRNVFGLSKAPPPPDPEANKPPPPKIFLTGITTILGNKRALMKLTPPAKPGEPAKEQSFTLAEKQRDGEVEVLEIDEKAGTVKVNEYGTIMTLSFTNNGVKAVTGAAPPGAPNPGGFIPGANPGMPPGGASPFARPLRLPTPGAMNSPAPGGAAAVNPGGASAYAGGALPYGGGGSMPAMAGGGLSVGGTSVALSGSTAAQAQQQAAASPTSQLPTEQQFLLVEAERARLLQQQAQGVNLHFPPMPPTPFTKELNPDPTPTTPTPTPTPTTTLPSFPRSPFPPPILPHP